MVAGRLVAQVQHYLSRAVVVAGSGCADDDRRTTWALAAAHENCGLAAPG